MSDLPPYGLYKTTRALGDHVPAGRLVSFHNHGSPGPGVYLPSGWSANRASFHQNGHNVDEAFARTLEPLPPEGLYRVAEPFTCCEKNCRTFERDLLVQLGYDGDARAIVFVPEWTAAGLALPQTGSIVDPPRLARLAALKVPKASGEPSPGGLVH